MCNLLPDRFERKVLPGIPLQILPSGKPGISQSRTMLKARTTRQREDKALVWPPRSLLLFQTELHGCLANCFATILVNGKTSGRGEIIA